MLFRSLNVVVSKSHEISFKISKWLFAAIIALLFLYLLSCDDNPIKYEPPHIDPIDVPVPYQDISISEDGNQLIFYRTKFTYISHDPYQTKYEPDSVGIWICNIDGTGS